MVAKIVGFVAFLLAFSEALERNERCVTPNGENAMCIPVKNCLVMAQALSSRNQSAIQYAQKAQCGYDSDPLVCCGAHAFFVTTTTTPSYFDFFTKETTTSRPVTTRSTTTEHYEVSQTFSNTKLPDQSICGLERDRNRVWGGEVTNIDEFPWMVLIRYNFTNGQDAGFRCGGTLINNRYVLTAAHCVRVSLQMMEIYSVRLGEWRQSTDPDCIEDEANYECSDPVVDVLVEQAIPHSYYSTKYGNNDIALLRMARNIEYSEFIRPICLPPSDLAAPPAGVIMVACGWGATENSTNSDYKLKVELPLISNSNCATKLNDDRTRISANHVCAGAIPGKDTCQGDSGGPLMRTYGEINDGDKQWYQEGIVSRGRGCGRPGIPGVYTRVARYINWLLNNLQE